MNAKHGRPAGTTGTITFEASAHMAARTVPAVRDANGNLWVPAANPHLWLPVQAGANFTAA